MLPRGKKASIFFQILGTITNGFEIVSLVNFPKQKYSWEEICAMHTPAYRGDMNFYGVDGDNKS